MSLSVLVFTFSLKQIAILSSIRTNEELHPCNCACTQLSFAHIEQKFSRHYKLFGCFLDIGCLLQVYLTA